MDDAIQPYAIHGVCDERFAAVKTAFEANFASGADVGASVAVTLDGEMVVDLWGGSQDKARTTPWEKDTMVVVHSTTKTMTALCALLLADRGELDLDAPIARYWPEFTANGKAGVLVRHALGHTAGLPGFDQPLEFEDLYDWEKITGVLAAQAPWWEPGTASAYHAITQGYLVGELIRRITGQSVGTFLARELAGPLGADCFIGLPEAEDHRTCEIIPPATPEPLGPPGTMSSRIGTNPRILGGVARDIRWRRSEIPAGNGVGNARGVARLQALLACGGEIGGKRMISEAGCEAVLRQQAFGDDLAFLTPCHWAMGFTLRLGPMFLGPRTCFWGGSGGSLIAVDLERRMSFCYVMNQMVAAPFGDARNTPLLMAALAAAPAS